jgi:hypothetical protein
MDRCRVFIHKLLLTLLLTFSNRFSQGFATREPLLTLLLIFTNKFSRVFAHRELLLVVQHLNPLHAGRLTGIGDCAL